MKLAMHISFDGSLFWLSLPLSSVSLCLSVSLSVSGGCQHYRRRVKLVAPCCGVVYDCRHCHNEER